jgi:hypothetical protein
MRRSLQRALREDPSSEAAKTLKKRYTSYVRRNKRRWHAGYIAKLKDDLLHAPRKYWKTARGRRVAKIVGTTEQWQGYIKELLGTHAAVNVSKHGSGPRPGVPVANTLSAAFSDAEIISSLKALKGGKAADVFGVRAEVIKGLLQADGPDGAATFHMLPHLVHCFNLVLEAGRLPSTWCQGCVHPIAKVQSPTGCDEYRCITVGSILGKLFAAVLDKRLGDYLEEHQLRSPFQGGFRQGYSPMDQAFVLNHIIEAAKHAGSQVYTAFVDFSKAFDTVRHEHLWDRLNSFGVDGNFLRCVQSMYEQSQACVAVNGGLTGYEKLLIGVRQGDPLSPTLFALYIDTLADELSAGMSPMDTFAVGGVPVFMLLYADDLVLISATPGALQRELDILEGFCADWDLTVNMGKTNTVVFYPKTKQRAYPWKLGNIPVSPATRYKYLGLIFDGQKGLKAAQGRLVDCGRKAMFGLMGICSQQEISDPSLRQHMWNALILPILSYGAELWGGLSPFFLEETYSKNTPGEKVHKTFLKWMTGAGPRTHSSVLPQAAGRLPLGAHWISRTTSYWNRLVAMDPTRLAHLAFRDNIALMHKGGECWASRAVHQFRSLGMLGDSTVFSPQVPLWDCTLDSGEAIARSTAEFWEFYKQRDPRCLPPRNVKNRTLHTFSNWFLQMTEGLPVHHNVPSKHWRRVVRFCTGSHRLNSSTAARHTQSNRAPGASQTGGTGTCRCCDLGAPEDELHLMLECPAYDQIRLQHTSLFAGTAPDTPGMRHIFQRANFAAISAYLRDSFTHRENSLEARNLLDIALAHG